MTIQNTYYRFFLCLLLTGCADHNKNNTGALDPNAAEAPSEIPVATEEPEGSPGSPALNTGGIIERPVTENKQPMKNIPESSTKENSVSDNNRAGDKKELPGEKLLGQIPPKVDHTPWNTILEKYVDAAGNVAYLKLAADLKPLESYLAMLSENPALQESPKNERLAYYINLYNAATVKLIADHYPLKSIKDIDSPWDTKWIKVGANQLSLGEIENDILRKMNEPRIHFAINCASVSCPQLPSRAFRAETMEEQLQEVTVAFIMDPAKNQLKTDPLQLSHIFDWYQADFTKGGSIQDYLNRYSSIPVPGDARIEFMEYDWGLNDSEEK